jgi:hypothetical protein
VIGSGGGEGIGVERGVGEYRGDCTSEAHSVGDLSDLKKYWVGWEEVKRLDYVGWSMNG